MRIVLLMLLSSLAFAKPAPMNLFVTNIQMSYEIDAQLWKWEREYLANDMYHASMLYHSESDSEKTVRVGISKFAKFPNEQKPRALRNQEEIPKLFSNEGGIGNCSFGGLEGYIQQGKDDSGEYTHVIMMEPTFGGIVFLFARGAGLEGLDDILKTFKTKVLK